MPKLDIDMFDKAPSVGDKVKVVGKIESIDEDAGEVHVSYDDVSIIGKKHHKKNNDDNSDDNNDDNNDGYSNEMMPESQSLDSALNRAFSSNQ